MSLRIVLSSVDVSAEFSERTLLLPPGGQVRVARAGGDDQPADDNAFFDSRVLSRSQAVLTFSNSQILLKDIGSRNGTFINGFRLSKPFQESMETPVYSEDVIRFGTQSKTVKEKCIFAKLRILLSSGEDYGTRPPDDRLLKLPDTSEHIYDEVPLESDDNPLLYHAVENKLIPKNDTKTLKESINKLKAGEDKMLQEISGLKRTLESKDEECKRVSDGVAINSEVQKDKISELERKLQEKESILQRSFNENAHLRNELDEKYKTLQTEMTKRTEEISFQKEKVDHLNKLLFETDVSLEEKEKEILRLIELLNKDQTKIEEKDGAFQELESLITEEDETLQEAEKEMRRLLDIISEDQETILNKDKMILALQNTIQEKDEIITKECGGISKLEMENLFKKTLDEQTMENEKNIAAMKACAEENQSQLDTLKNDIGEQKKLVEQKNLEIKDLSNTIEKHLEHVKTHEALKMKCQELMSIIIKQQSELEAKKNDSTTNDVVVSRNEILQKEVHVLKVAMQQKDMDIKSLNELLKTKEEIISENNLSGTKRKTLVSNDSGNDYEETICNLQQKIINEQEINDQAEEEIIQLRVEIGNLKKEIQSNSDGKSMINEDQSLLKIKEKEISELMTDLRKQKQLVDEIQVMQRNEMIEKEKEIFNLNKVLKEERQEWQVKEKKWIQLESGKSNIVEDTETVTIEDDCSDEEDGYMLVDDLEKS